MKIRSVVFFTSTRADFGLLKPLIQELKDQSRLEIKIVATGTHCLEEFGDSTSEILNSGFTIDHQFEIFNHETTPLSSARATAIMLDESARYLSESKPDLVVILGDRFEMLSAAIASSLLGIPIAHIAGGEVTKGALDDSFRHAITKLSSLHFCSAPEYKKRIIQLGEKPSQVFVVGSLAEDNFRNTPELSRDQIEKLVGFDIETTSFAICTLHPETSFSTSDANNTRILLECLESFHGLKVVFTRSNADAGGNEIWQMISEYALERPDGAFLKESLGQAGYLTLLKKAKFVIGNSSSGIYEAPSAGIPTVNIGSRQEGRLRAASVIDVNFVKTEIMAAIRKALDIDFSRKCTSVISPFGGAGASHKINRILSTIDFDALLPKEFFDLNIEGGI